MRQTPLPPAAEDKETRISITAGELCGEAELMAVAREEARIAVSSIDSEADVPSHPIIERTTAKLRKAKPAGRISIVHRVGYEWRSDSITHRIRKSLAPELWDMVRIFNERHREVLDNWGSCTLFVTGDQLDFGHDASIYEE